MTSGEGELSISHAMVSSFPYQQRNGSILIAVVDRRQTTCLNRNAKSIGTGQPS